MPNKSATAHKPSPRPHRQANKGRTIPPKPENTNGNPTITLLKNSHAYFLQHTFIVEQENGFRLIVLMSNRILYDHFYRTAQGAKIAFNKLFSYRKASPKIKGPIWSHWYDADPNWINDKTAKPTQKDESSCTNGHRVGEVSHHAF